MEMRPILVYINKFIPFIFKRYCLLDSAYGVDSDGLLYMYVVNVNNKKERIKFKLFDLVHDELFLAKLDRESISMIFTVYGLALGCKDSGSYHLMEILTENRMLRMLLDNSGRSEDWSEQEFYSRINEVDKNSIFRAVLFFSNKDFGDTL